MKNLTVDAVIENLGTVTEFIDEILMNNGCPIKTQMQIDVAIDEIFSNIANYAYGKNDGQVTVECEYNNENGEFSMIYTDSGIPYNPLEKEDPDITLSAEERGIGGLGIFLVKKTMDEIIYNYTDKKNVLKIIKRF